MTVPRLGVWWVLAVGLALGVVVVATDGERLRLAGYIMAASLAAAAVLRLVLPRGVAGGLVVRGRVFDVLTLVVLAVGMAVLATVIDLGPTQ